MVVSNAEFQVIIEKLPESKLNKLKQYAVKLLNEEQEEFNKGLDFLFNNYNEALDRLKDR
ncbi:hypothetical protein [Paenibacillus sp. IHBB 10380]|uniref:hypothetical protein n=1 Tax=Paenibacillus sp. IHBB 10380 TaxID=1566358 RepID=UPI0005CF980C|nr:hypothetical protein [Paenibacillus sp. IHBB 10380]AJS59997.1 hypothetical protein UB51_17690 [Paenibacillus sp. IHBB 10380]